MLSKSILWKNRVYAVCERSGDILPGAAFKGVRLADRDEFDFIPAKATVVCSGYIRDNELLLCTEDGRVYFSLRDGWGEENGVLYGLRLGICYDFRHPTTVRSILSECDAAIGTYHTWGGAMAYQSRKYALDAIRAVMEKVTL